MSAQLLDFEAARAAKKKRDHESYLRRKAAGTLWRRMSAASYRLREFGGLVLVCDDCRQYLPTKFFAGDGARLSKCLCRPCAVVAKLEKS